MSDKDLAALKAVSQESLADKRCWEIVAKANDIFIGGSMRDSIWQTV